MPPPLHPVKETASAQPGPFLCAGQSGTGDPSRDWLVTDDGGWHVILAQTQPTGEPVQCVADAMVDLIFCSFGSTRSLRTTRARLTRRRGHRAAARAPKLDIFADSFVLRDDNGWHITEGGRQFLASLEAPLPIAAPPVQAPKQPRSPARPTLRLVVNNEKESPDGRQEGPSRRSA
jgi:hypothetical protein